jgi:hypothetical protein
VTPNPAPKRRKASQKIQLKRDRTTVLLRTKIGSLRTTKLRKKSTAIVVKKSAAPISSAVAGHWGEGRTDEEKPATKQRTAITMIAFVNDGRKNSDE